MGEGKVARVVQGRGSREKRWKAGGRGRRKAARETLGIPQEDVVVGITCRLIEQKGLIYGLEAFARAAQGRTQRHGL
jgi:hypothetical protein